MADELTDAVAMELARSLKTIDGFPWDVDTIKATAEDLQRWCTGAFVLNVLWPAEAQARWIITHARENWVKWQGTAELRALFRAKFAPQAKAPGNAVTDWANQPCVCGSGEKFRSCCQGKPVDFDLDQVKTVPVRVRRARGAAALAIVAPAVQHVRTPEEQARLDQIAKQFEDLERGA